MLGWHFIVTFKKSKILRSNLGSMIFSKRNIYLYIWGSSIVEGDKAVIKHEPISHIR